MCIFCEQDPILIGEFFGYPKCCTNWYKEHGEKYGKGSTDHFSDYQEAFHKATVGLGFVPCPNCAKNIITNNLTPEKFIKNRIATLPFPREDEKTIDEFTEWIKLKQKQNGSKNLQRSRKRRVNS
jgi:hypothetical protein